MVTAIGFWILVVGAALEDVVWKRHDRAAIALLLAANLMLWEIWKHVK